MKWNEVVLVTIKTTSYESQKEIIEIGLCNFNVKSLRRYDPISLFVKPLKTKVTEQCTQVTGITASDVSDAVSFCDLCDFMQQTYKTNEKPWASYGNFAEIIFKKQCHENNIEYPLSDRFINIRHYFPLIFSQENEIPLREALHKLDIPAGSNSCEDDVLNMGILLAEVLRGGALLKK